MQKRNEQYRMGGYTIGQNNADVLQGGRIKPVDKRSKRGTGKKT